MSNLPSFNQDAVSTLENDVQVVQFFPANTITPMDWYEFLSIQFRRLAPPRDLKTRGTLRAIIRHGRWLACCPFCGEYLPVSKADPRFCCIKCSMEGNGGYALLVVFPVEAAQIETILGMRPIRENRNWQPSESVAKLAQENIDHGCTSIIKQPPAPAQGVKWGG